ncbi:TIGR00659 family protein [Fibrobacter sp. UWB15]|jgi:predicted murein hydrolase (TIGR00659 family)|uniref:LrgB family protein n=1 Tax=unclassified Fibrobacter TaxID=2634177 RepID=UPI000912DEAA|nr:MULTISPECIES: LrgB family protein [unclassified Fibrobacter]PWJ67220.1 putative murein hydrolase (TIGR00659 family) [Fibrobacter sp. UWB6]SHF61521.1 TIGR00659 family protein [Fibrobacter sp. UWB8]SMG08123.1 TIGR00659 family protein [Fibrobacter sp. UWB15]
MNAIINSPLFGILLTLVTFEIGVTISKKFKYSFLNPLLIANILIVGFLLITGISLESYNVGGDYISVMLSPATVVLAVPLYRQISKLKQFWKPILAGIFAGSLTSLACVIVVSKLVGLSETLMLSLLPKSITIPMGSVVSAQIGGIPPVTIIAITITGITGAVSAPAVCRFCRIKHKVAQGIAIGTASHALGTTRAMEMGEVQGAMSSLSIGVAGLFTAIVTPIILSLIP